MAIPNMLSDRRRLGHLLLTALLALGIAAVVAGQWWLHEQRLDTSRESAVRNAAETAVTSVLSYDYRALKTGVADTTPLVTGAAKVEYLQAQKALRSRAPKLKAIVDAQVKTVTVLQSDADSARVLLFVDQTSSSTKLTRPQLDQSRILVTLQHSGDSWLVSTLAAI